MASWKERPKTRTKQPNATSAISPEEFLASLPQYRSDDGAGQSHAQSVTSDQGFDRLSRLEWLILVGPGASRPPVCGRPRLPKMAMPVIFVRMMTQALNVNLTTELRRFLKEQVRSGRYQNENEVVRDAIRQMQQREMEQFERIFGEYRGAPQGEPTEEDQAAIQAAIQRHRRARQAAPKA